jgi:hypothetical protein
MAGQSVWNPAHIAMMWFFAALIARSARLGQGELPCHLHEDWALLVVHAHGV